MIGVKSIIACAYHTWYIFVNSFGGGKREKCQRVPKSFWEIKNDTEIQS